MDKINTMMMVTLLDALAMVKAAGSKKTFKLLSQPGVGKTTALSALAAEMPWSGGVGMQFVYVYVPDKRDIADIGVWIPDMTVTPPTLRFVTNPAYHIDPSRPTFLFLDEVDKASNIMQTLLTPTMTNPKRLGDIMFHPESVTVLASNFSTDGVGDKQQDHAVNRQTTLFIRNHTGPEWVHGYAQGAGCHPVVMTWALKDETLWEMAMLNPQSTNAKIFNPKRAKGLNRAFVSPRSLMQASETLYEFDAGLLNERQMMAALRGEIGDAGALELASFLHIHKEVPTMKEVVLNPTAATVPTHPSAQIMVVLGACTFLGKAVRGDIRVDNSNGPMTAGQMIGAWFTFLDRLPSVECQRLFNDTVKVENTRLFDAVTSHPAFAKWANKNEHVL